MTVNGAYKIILLIVFLSVVFELGQAMYFMVADRKKPGSRRIVWALTFRVALSLLLVILIVTGVETGILHPHNTFVP